MKNKERISDATCAWKNYISHVDLFKRASRTFSVFVSVLEGLHQPQSLIHRSSHRKIVHGDLPQDAFVVDDEESPERESSMTHC